MYSSPLGDPSKPPATYSQINKGRNKKIVSFPSIWSLKVTMKMLKSLQILKTIILKQALFCHLNSSELVIYS